MTPKLFIIKNNGLFALYQLTIEWTNALFLPACKYSVFTEIILGFHTLRVISAPVQENVMIFFMIYGLKVLPKFGQNVSFYSGDHPDLALYHMLHHWTVGVRRAKIIGFMTSPTSRVHFEACNASWVASYSLHCPASGPADLSHTKHSLATDLKKSPACCRTVQFRTVEFLLGRESGLLHVLRCSAASSKLRDIRTARLTLAWWLLTWHFCKS